MRYRPLPVGSIRPRGWLRQQVACDSVGITGRLPELTRHAASERYIRKSVRRAAGPDSWWDGEVEGNWLDGLVRQAAVLDYPGLGERAASYLRRIVKASAADGYLGVYAPDQRFPDSAPDGELWCQSRVLLALVAWYDATGDREFLDAAVRGADVLVEHYRSVELAPGATIFDQPSGADNGRAHGISVVEPLVQLFDRTGERRFLEFAEFCYDQYSRADIDARGNDCQLPKLLDPSAPFRGHGVHTCEGLRLPLMLADATGKDRYREAFWAGYTKITRHLMVGGACKSDEHIGVLGVPLPGLGFEYCTVTELLMTLIYGACATGEFELAERAELLAYNAAQAARYPDGTAIAYLSADNTLRASSAHGRKWKYSPTHEDGAVCCAANFGRTLVSMVSAMVTQTSDHGLAVVFYGPGVADASVRGVDVRLEQDTRFPFEDTVKVIVNPDEPVEFALELRLPSWSETTQIRVNGDDVGVDDAGDRAVIGRRWEPGDTVTVVFRPRISTVPAADGTVALKRGPLVFALPIPDTATVSKTYGLDGFTDTDHEPQPGAVHDLALLVDPNDPQRSVSVVHRQTGSTDPWNDPPVRLRMAALNARFPGTQGEDLIESDGLPAGATEVELVPMGSTILRRTCLPMAAVSSRLSPFVV